LEFSADDILQHLAIQRQIGGDLLQLGVLLLKLLEAAHLRRQQPVVLLLPVEVGCLADPGLAADLRHRHAVRVLLEDERLLGV
jgi:hypothetical protein